MVGHGRQWHVYLLPECLAKTLLLTCGEEEGLDDMDIIMCGTLIVDGIETVRTYSWLRIQAGGRLGLTPDWHIQTASIQQGLRRTLQGAVKAQAELDMVCGRDGLPREGRRERSAVHRHQSQGTRHLVHLSDTHGSPYY